MAVGLCRRYGACRQGGSATTGEHGAVQHMELDDAIRVHENVGPCACVCCVCRLALGQSLHGKGLDSDLLTTLHASLSAAHKGLQGRT